MEILFFGIIVFIAMIFRLIGAIFYMLWKFKINPIIEEGTKNGYYYEPWDYKLWGWFFFGNKPQHRNVP